MWKELSPLSSRSHMVDDFSTELFVFLGGVGFVEDIVMTIFETATAKNIFHTKTVFAVKSIFAVFLHNIAKEGRI